MRLLLKRFFLRLLKRFVFCFDFLKTGEFIIVTLKASRSYLMLRQNVNVLAKI